MWIFECRDPSHGAFKLGLSAAMLLVAAHALSNLLGGCMCVWSKEQLDRATANKQLAVASLILSWIVVGCLLHADQGSDVEFEDVEVLQIGSSKANVDRWGRFVHGLFRVAYFVYYRIARKKEKTGRQSGGPE